MKERTGISAEYLLKGTWYAFEQSGRLIQHAVTLYDNRAHSTTVALALFASEGLGNGRTLLDLWRDVVLHGRGVEPGEVMAACADHDRKQMRARLRAMRGAGETGAVAQAAWTLAWHPLDVRQAARQRALYVDPNVAHLLGAREQGTGWNRPSEIPKEEARQRIERTANDYASQHDRLRPEMLRVEDPALATALDAWPDRPALPLPKRPEFA